MKYFLLIILIIGLIFGATKIYAASNNSRFDWTLGQPAITNDTTTVCTDTAKNRYDWVLGQPATTFDAIATCTAGAPTISGLDDGIIWFY